MLAIMNIGKYSSSGIVPSGSDLFTISASQSLGQAIDFYARKANTILGLPYMQNVIYRSTDGGATWSSVSLPYYLAHVFYSPIKDKFYALELGNENVPQTLHYGVSDDGVTWTWNVLYENSTEKLHYYGTYIEESNNDIAFDILKVDATQVATLNNKAILSHIKVFTDNTEELIGSPHELGSSTSGSTSIDDVFPVLTSNSGKTITGFVIESWRWVGTTYYQTKQITIGSWGVEAEAAYSGSAYMQGVKCFDKFYYTNRSGSSSSYSTNYIYSPTVRSNTYVVYVTPSRTSALTFYKIYGFFQLGNYFYMAYQDDNATKWYRAGNIETLIQVAIADTFAKADLTGIPVSEYSLDNKHFILSMADGKIYLCEAT